MDVLVAEVVRAGRIMSPILASAGSVRHSSEALGAYKGWRDAVAYAGQAARYGHAEAAVSYDSLRGTGASADFVKVMAECNARRAKHTTENP